MTTEQSRLHEDTAISFREKDTLYNAAEYYTLAAYENLGAAPPTRHATHVAYGLYYLLHAASCYRTCGAHELGRTRCRQGLLLTQEMNHRIESEPPPTHEYNRARWGVWDEFAGDFHVIADEPEAAATAYDGARETYTAAEDITLIYAEQEHMYILQFYKNLLKAAGEDLDAWTDLQLELTFPEWIDHKRERFPGMVADLIDRATWNVDDGDD